MLKELFYRIKPWWAFATYWRLRKRFSAELFPYVRRSVQQRRLWGAQYRRDSENAYSGFRGSGPVTILARTHYGIWKGVFANRPAPLRILEIGSWMGSSAVGFARLFPNANISCIDAWEGGDRLNAKNNPEKCFDKNTAVFGNRIRKLKGTSSAMLAKLAADGEKFDLIYVDASHYEDDVRSDTDLSWPLLNAGGVMIWDDYLFEYPPFGDKTPKPAIDEFLRENRGDYRVLFALKQVIAEKTR